MTERRFETTSTSTSKPVRSRPRTTGVADEERPVRRPGWRQRLVDVERGMVLGLRADGTLFVLLFGVALTLLAGFVVGLTLKHWIAVVLALTVVLAAGMFHQLLKSIWNDLGHHVERTAAQAVRIGTAAVCMAAFGGSLTIVLVFVDHYLELFRG